MGKVVVNGVSYSGISDLKVTADSSIELCKHGYYDDSVNANKRPIIILQNVSASHVRVVNAAYIKSGKINQINANTGYFDAVDFVVESYYERKGFVPDIESAISHPCFKNSFTPVICSGKFDTVYSNVSYADLYGLSCIVLSTRGCVDMVSGQTVFSRVSPILGFTGTTVYCPTF